MTQLRAQKEGAHGGTTGSPTSTRWATFDCYGTLIDWNGGLRAELARLWPSEDADELLLRYHELEPEIEQAEPGLSYRRVMQRVLARLGDVAAGEEDALGRSLPDWRAFPEVRGALEQARARGWKLAILSNTDRDFVEASKAAIGVVFDETIVASEIGSYKPAHKHWEEFYARTVADPARHVHVAQSMFHDVVVANELGLPSVWINRLGESYDTEPTRELPDLERLPETLDELVPA
jgi:2-haloacid dehalogenase